MAIVTEGSTVWLTQCPSGNYNLTVVTETEEEGRRQIIGELRMAMTQQGHHYHGRTAEEHFEDAGSSIELEFCQTVWL